MSTNEALSHKAIDVMYAVFRVFARRGNETYAIDKTNTFLRRCGAKIDEPDGRLDSEDIIMTANAMLSTEEEEELFSTLYKEES